MSSLNKLGGSSQINRISDFCMRITSRLCGKTHISEYKKLLLLIGIQFVTIVSIFLAGFNRKSIDVAHSTVGNIDPYNISRRNIDMTAPYTLPSSPQVIENATENPIGFGNLREID